MKKVTLFIAALFVAGSAFAFDGKCCKGKKETSACSKEKKEACEKGKGCCKKDAKASADASATTKPAKEAKTPAATK